MTMEMKTVDDLTQDQIKEYREAFNFFDKDGDGTISCSEIRTVMQTLGQNPTEADIAGILEEYDNDGNGSLDFQEFLEMIVAKMKDPEEELRNAFKFLDKDGNGTVSLEELRVIITQLGDKLSDEEVHEMFSKADVNNDGQLDYEEFIMLMTSKE